MNPLIVCFGEILWDVLPTSKQPGGAPMNVAADLRNFGVNAQLISRVGNDELGNELIDFLKQKGIPTELVQTGQSHLTGVAKANVSDANEVTYKIVQPVAWDYIQLTQSMEQTVKQSNFFVYGSLVARSQQSHETLLSLLKIAPHKVFDVNLRAPHYTRELVEDLLHQAHIAKLNEHELAELAAWYGNSTNLHVTMQTLQDRYSLDTVCVTLGAQGAALLNKDGFFQQSGFIVEVKDTIGSGDAFLAAFLYKTLQNEEPKKTIEFACATGAFLATKQGATPQFSEEDIYSFLAKAQILSS
ncbi:carbohydrate kinase family protein [Xanthocytophaga flava]|uniref:carbohydrate kinase family protein n=1 Tax=Xanthocytophaga flava TaxID=3048013 RepID=UPI0028D02166|nr:carbohydrate kinase [Xanthocytophaga flavus]MDJ1466582.1 carbohydrate kinase [Xanthocytophaga flavus]